MGFRTWSADAIKTPNAAAETPQGLPGVWSAGFGHGAAETVPLRACMADDGKVGMQGGMGPPRHLASPPVRDWQIGHSVASAVLPEVFRRLHER